MSLRVAVYVSGHGYGHSVRTAQVCSALLNRGAAVLVRTDAPRWLFPAAVSYLPESIDVGVAQRDGLELDIDATRARWTTFSAEFDERAASEASFLREHRMHVVLGDIPPLAFAAAARAGVPSVALGNFTWDWIYSVWPDFGPIISCIRSGYADASVLLRLPLHSTDSDAFCAFRQIEDVPLIARCASQPRAAVRSALGLAEDARCVLLSFGAWTTAIDLTALAALPEYTFVVTPPLSFSALSLPGNVLCLPEQPDDYVSLLAACDVVVTKPGFGIVADCLANRVPVLFTDRGPFREYDILADALLTLGPARHISQEDLRTANLGEDLAALLSQPAHWQPIAVNGAEVAAERVLHLAR